MQVPVRTPLQTLAYYIGLYRIYCINYARRLIEYRADTFVGILGGLMMQGGFLVFLHIVYQRIPSLNGWTANELLFLFGFVTLGRELSRMFLDSPFRVGFIIRRGQLDTFIIRPCSTLFQVVAIDVQIVAFGGALVGLGVMIAALLAMPGAPHPLLWLWLPIAVLCNAFLQYAILMIIASLSFRLSEVGSILLPISWLYEFNRYPIDIFPAVMQGLLIYVLPFTVAAFFPVAFFLRPEQYVWVPIVVPLVTISLMALSVIMWNRGLKHYTSANA